MCANALGSAVQGVVVNGQVCECRGVCACLEEQQNHKCHC